MPLSVPFSFGTAGPNTPASRLDADYSAITDWINLRNPTIGVIAARPNAGNAGALYIASDQNNRIYIDDGAIWQTVTIDGVTVLPERQSVTITNSATLTSLLVNNFAAFAMNVAMRRLRSESQFIFTNSSGIDSSFAIRVYWAGNQLIEMLSGPLASTGFPRGCQLLVTLTTNSIGTAGTFVVSGSLILGTAAASGGSAVAQSIQTGYNHAQTPVNLVNPGTLSIAAQLQHASPNVSLQASTMTMLF